MSHVVAAAPSASQSKVLAPCVAVTTKRVTVLPPLLALAVHVARMNWLSPDDAVLRVGAPGTVRGVTVGAAAE